MTDSEGCNVQCKYSRNIFVFHKQESRESYTQSLPVCTLELQSSTRDLSFSVSLQVTTQPSPLTQYCVATRQARKPFTHSQSASDAASRALPLGEIHSYGGRPYGVQVRSAL